MSKGLPNELSLVLPMFNEAGNIERAVERAREVLPTAVAGWEVILVDDGSSDRTPELADALAAGDDRIRVVHHPRNRGYGAALRSGFEAAKYPLIAFTDGDNQFDLGEIKLILGLLDGADIVSGYRIVRKDPPIRRLNAFLYNGLARKLFDIPVRDVNCAFKVYRREVLDGLELKSTGALINVEVLARARKRGAVVREVGVSHFPRAAGSQTGANLSVILRMFSELFGLWRELR